jgi:hypothetical protein
MPLFGSHGTRETRNSQQRRYEHSDEHYTFSTKSTATTAYLYNNSPKTWVLVNTVSLRLAVFLRMF